MTLDAELRVEQVKVESDAGMCLSLPLSCYSLLPISLTHAHLPPPALFLLLTLTRILYIFSPVIGRMYSEFVLLSSLSFTEEEARKMVECVFGHGKV